MVNFSGNDSVLGNISNFIRLGLMNECFIRIWLHLSKNNFVKYRKCKTLNVNKLNNC